MQMFEDGEDTLGAFAGTSAGKQSLKSLQKQIIFFFMADGRVFAMTRKDLGGIRQHEKPAADGPEQGIGRSTWQIAAADGFIKQRITGKKEIAMKETDPPRGMPRRIQDLHHHLPHLKLLAATQPMVDFEGLRRREAEELRLQGHAGEIELFFLMGVDRRAGRLLHLSDSTDMIEMTMRQENGRDGKLIGFDLLHDGPGFIAGIDDRRKTGLRTAQNIAVNFKRTE